MSATRQQFPPAPAPAAAREVRAERSPYTPPRLLTFGGLSAITATSKPKGKRDKTSRKTGY